MIWWRFKAWLYTVQSMDTFSEDRTERYVSVSLLGSFIKLEMAWPAS